MIVEKQKNYLIWLLKIVATIMVIYIHGANIFSYSKISMPDYLRPFSMLTITGVPLFMIISGYLFFHKEGVDWKVNLLRKTKRLAIPFLIWSGFWIVLEAVGFLLLPSKFENVYEWSFQVFLLKWIGIPFSSMPLYAPLWYVRDLFIISVFVPFIQRSLVKYSTPLLVVLTVLWFAPINNMLRQTIVLFIIGELLKITSKKIENLRMDFRIGFLTLAFGIVFSFIKIDFFNRLTIMLYLISIFLLCKELINNDGIKIKCEYLASFIFMIYVLHGKPLSVMQIIYTLVFYSTGMVIAGYFLIPIICFFVCLIVGMAFSRALPCIYKFCTGE